MRRTLIVCLIAVGALALLGTASALAAGPSAGDQQYIDPLAGTGHSQSSSPSSSSSASSPSSSSSSSSATPSTSSAPTTSTAATPSTSGSPITTASTTTTPSTTASASTGQDSTSNSLPATGMNVLLGALLGVGLLASGAFLRRSARRA